jgi:hypothetical protein
MQDYSQLERFGVHYCHPTPDVNDPEALNEIFDRITGTASGGAFDGIGAVNVSTGITPA